MNTQVKITIEKFRGASNSEFEFPDVPISFISWNSSSVDIWYVRKKYEEFIVEL